MPARLDLPRAGSRAAVAVTIAAVVGVSALLARIGSDARWLAALGHEIAARGAIPAGIPFAGVSAAHWPNPVVLAELIFAGLESLLGDRGLMLAQLLAVAGALALVARDARAGGASSPATAAALVLISLGSISSFAIVRVQLFSLLLMPALVLLLRSDARAPSRRIWLAVPLLALWSNLHGTALLGLGILGCQLLGTRARRRPLEALAIAAASAVALCATTAGLRTVDYYHGVLTNVAAQRGAGMWAPLSPHSPFDLLLIVAVLAALLPVVRARPAPWEWLVIAALAVATVRADRDGVWLQLFLTAPAARGLARVGEARAPGTRAAPAQASVGARRRRIGPAGAAGLAAALAGCLGVVLLVGALARGPVPSGASSSLVKRAVALASGSPVLADGSIDEQVALAGGRIWAGDPIDAFSAPVQATYLDWVAGSTAGEAAVAPDVRVVLVTRGSASQTLMAGLHDFTVARADATAVLYERVGTHA